MRLDNAKGDMKRSRLERERDRDVSEKVALGLLKGSAKLTGEAQFDKRLFGPVVRGEDISGPPSALIRLLERMPWLAVVPAYVVGVGVLPERAPAFARRSSPR